MRLKEIKEQNTWRAEDYSSYLKRKGYIYPLHEASNVYINVTGQSRHIPKNKPFALISYEPVLKEQFFATPNEALEQYKKDQPTKYQIINIRSGKVLADPNREIKPKK